MRVGASGGEAAGTARARREMGCDDVYERPSARDPLLANRRVTPVRPMASRSPDTGFDSRRSGRVDAGEQNDGLSARPQRRVAGCPVTAASFRVHAKAVHDLLETSYFDAG